MNTLRLSLLVAAAFALRAQAIVISYGYDAADRLTAVSYNGTSRTAFGYDKNGNLLTRTSTVTGVTMPPSFAATYNGLITNAAPALGNTGSITLKLLANGAFTGKVTIEGLSYSIAGTFSATGATAPIFIDRAAPKTDLTLTLALDVVNGSQQITGSITDGSFTSSVVLEAARYNTTTNLLPAGLAARYTALLKPTQVAAAIPLGDGYATLSISSSGAITLAGKLPNNVAISQSSTVVGMASWPLFIPLHSSKGYLTGAVNFVWKPGVSDFESTLAWEKPVTLGTYYSGAFTTQLNLIGSRFDTPVSGQRVLYFRATSPNAVFTATDGNLAASPLVRNVTLASTNKFIIPVDAAALKLTPTLTTGYFTGSFKDGLVTRTMHGVLFQEANMGSGFFTGSSLSGSVKIEGQP